MIPFFDAFIDTRRKRYHLFLLIVLLIFVIFLLPYLFIGFQLLKLSSYDSLFSLLQEPWMESTYIARIIGDCISLSSFDFLAIIQVLLTNVGIIEIGTLVAGGLAYPILEQKKATTFCLMLFMVMMIASACLVFVGLQATSLQYAMNCLRILGGVVFGVNGIVLCVLFYYIRKRIIYYKKALHYQCVEIKEHMES